MQSSPALVPWPFSPSPSHGIVCNGIDEGGDLQRAWVSKISGLMQGHG